MLFSQRKNAFVCRSDAFQKVLERDCLKRETRKTVLCVAYVFPPVSETGAHRTRAVVRHLPEFGWESVVVTADADLSLRRDPYLLQGLPEGLTVYQTAAPSVLGTASRIWSRIRRLAYPRMAVPAVQTLSSSDPSRSAKVRRGLIDWASRWLQVPDLAIGWLPYGVRTAVAAAKRHHCEAIYTSAPPFTAHLIGLLTKGLTGLPWIADFRDPWTANPFRTIPYRSVSRYDSWLERLVVHNADWIICNCEPVREEFESRFPNRVGRFITITNGYEPDDFEGLQPHRPADNGKLLLTHTGFFYGPRRPHSLFEALQILDKRDATKGRIVLQLAGPSTYEGEPLINIARRFGVDHMVIVRGQVSHREALELLCGSDIQVAVGFKGPGAELQVPAKLFEYLGSGKPILAIAPKRSTIANVLANSGAVNERCEPDNPDEIASAIVRLSHLSDGRRRSPIGCSNSNSSFIRRRQVRLIASLLDESLLGPSPTDRRIDVESAALPGRRSLGSCESPDAEYNCPRFKSGECGDVDARRRLVECADHDV